MARQASSPWVSGALVVVVVGLVLAALWVSRPDPPTPLAPDPAPAPVHVRTVRVEPRVHELVAYGETSPVRSAQLAAEQTGRVVWRSPALNAGARVEAGEVLLRLDPARFEAARDEAAAALSAARAQVRLAEREQEAAEVERAQAAEAAPLAEREAERQRRLFEEGAGSESLRDRARERWIAARGRLRAAEAAVATAAAGVEVAAAAVQRAEATLARAEDELARTELRAPFAGRVDAVHVELGSSLVPGAPVCALLDLAELRVLVALPTGPSLDLDRSAEVEIRFPGLLDARGEAERRRARVHALGPAARAGSRSRPLELRFENPNELLPAGLFAEAALSLGERRAIWLRPAEFRLDDAGARAVVVHGDRAELRVLKLGPTLVDEQGRTWHPVLDGLRDGDTIATDNLEAPVDGGPVLVLDGPAASDA